MSLVRRSSGRAKQFARFSLVGFVNTGIGYAVIFVLVYYGCSPYLSNLLGYGVGLVSSFFLSKTFVFNKKSRKSNEWLRYVVAFMLAYACNLMMLYVGLLVGFGIYVSQALASVVYLLAMFVLSRLWVFS